VQRTYLALAALAALAVAAGSLNQRAASALPSLPPPLPAPADQTLGEGSGARRVRTVALEVIPYDATRVPVEAPADQAFAERLSSR